MIRITQKRPFVLARSNFIGFDRYAAHWTGDYGMTWEDLRCGIPTMLSYGLFGVLMIGSDICRFHGNALGGVFYPFA
ncbi:putative alpha-glucosidase [Acorus gramineus]|uniref:Alpha-glucosidase n=1 Tax=Acorus gramineus TaxID=55184 RepID=A0AAV9A8U6_ACOGR|nr:putative alpha-glucosidase [Acorus gramineus]